MSAREVEIDVDGGARRIVGTLDVLEGARALIIFAHGSGSSRHSPRNQFVARELSSSGFATLLADLLTPEEDAVDRETFSVRFDVGLLGTRLLDAARWSRAQLVDRNMPIGYFGASTGAAAALIAAASWPDPVFAVVSRGGRPDLAADSLARVKAPSLLIVGGDDPIVLDLNRRAARQMRCEVRLEVVPRATHLFEESGALEHVADLARRWFAAHIGQPGTDGDASRAPRRTGVS